MPWVRIIETIIDNPKTPSQTENVKKYMEKYNSKLFKDKKKNKIINKLKTINSKLNNIFNKCL